MAGFRDTTAKTVQVPVVLVVGSADLTARCRDVVRAPGATPAHVKDCDLRSVATMVARWRPLAIVLTEDLYQFDAREFEALAKDVQSMLVRVPRERVDSVRLEALLLPALEKYWRGQGRGR